MKIFSCRYRVVTARVMLVLTIATLLTMSSLGWASASPRTEVTEKSVSFSIEKLSPYSIQNSAVSLIVSTQVPDAIFTIAVLSPTNTRSELFDFAENLGKRRVRNSIEVALSQFTPSATIAGQYSIDLAVNADSAESLSFSGSGVFPLAISARSGTEKATNTQYSFVTNIPNVGSSGFAYSQRLSIVPILQFSPFIDRPSLIDNDGLSEYGTKIRTQFLDVSNTMESLASIGAPASVLLSPESLDTFSVIQSTNENDFETSLFSSPTPSIEYLTDTYTPINIAELEKHGLSREYSNLLATGRSVVTRSGFVAAARTLVTQAITPDSMEMIARTGIDNVIVDDTTFDQESSPTSRPVTIEKNSSSLSIAAANTSITEHLPLSLSDSAQANYLLAATSVVALESPSIARSLILPLDLAQLSDTTLKQFLGGTLNNPLITTTTTAAFFSQLNSDKALSKRLSKARYPKVVAQTFTREQVNSIENNARATESMFSPTTSEFQAAQWMKNVVYSRTDRKVNKLINVESSKELVESVENFIALPNKRTLTITSRESNIPVTIRNTSETPISVTVRLKSKKLSFPEGSSFSTVLDEQNNTVAIPVKARTSGSFPISIEIVSPDGNVIVGEQSATVRSTAVSGAGVTIAIASALFLALWWGSHFRRSRKKPLATIIELPQENVG